MRSHLRTCPSVSTVAVYCRSLILACAVVAGVFLLAPHAYGIVVLGAQGRNCMPPTDSLQGSGWQYEGKWGEFAATAIGPHHFLTAKHVGGFVGDTFYYAGRAYEAINYTVIPGADITVWTVEGDLPYWAPLYAGHSEPGSPAILFGRGTSRGEPVIADGRLRGWGWGPGDGRLSWGTSRVRAILPVDMSNIVRGGKVTEMLALVFAPDGGSNEGTASSGDSGGGVFLRENGQWKLAGVTHAVAANYRNGGETISCASLFDARGMERISGNRSVLIDSTSGDPAANVTLATRLAPHYANLQELLQQPPHRQWLSRPRWLSRNSIGLLGKVSSAFLGLLLTVFAILKLAPPHKIGTRELPPLGDRGNGPASF